MQGRLIEWLHELVSIPSGNPSDGEEAIASWIEMLLYDQDIPSRRITFAPGRPSLYASLEGNQPGSLLLCGHLDTVPAADGWKAPPCRPRLEGGRLYGLGAADMKGGVAMLLDAFCRVKEQASRRDPLRYGLKLVLTADEEDRYLGADAFARSGLLSDALFLLVAEPTNGALLVGERGEFWLRATFFGKEAHGSTPEKGHNAVMACARFLDALIRRVGSLEPDPLLGPATVNPGRIEGGRQINIVPDRCQAEIDIRLGSEETRRQVEEILLEEGERAAAGGDFQWEMISYKRPMRADPADPHLRSFAKAVETCHGTPSLKEVASFCTDLPTLFPGEYPPFAIFGPGDIAQAHQNEEYIELASLERESAVLQHFLERELVF